MFEKQILQSSVKINGVWEFKYQEHRTFSKVLTLLGYAFENGLNPASLSGKMPDDLSQLHYVMLCKITHMSHIGGS